MKELPIPPDFRLVVTIYKLYRGHYIYTIGEMCGLATATVCKIVSETCILITNTLWGETVKRHFLTSEEDIRHCMGKFGKEWQFPNASAAADGSHLPIKCPTVGGQANLGFSKSFGKLMILLCCNPLIFGKKVVGGEMIPNVVQQVEDVEIPHHFLGDGAFPLRTFMMKPHGDDILPDDKRYFKFNHRHSRARVVTEEAFERLKSRFRVLFHKC